MIFSENLFPLESDCGIMELSTNRNLQMNFLNFPYFSRLLEPYIVN